MLRALTALIFLACCCQCVLALDIDARHSQEEGSDYAIELSWPHVGVEVIDREIEAWVKRAADEFRDSVQPDPEWESSGWTFEIEHEVLRNDAQVLALLFRTSSFTGGAHGSLDIETRNYRLPEGKRLDLREVLDGERGLAKLSELVIADLEEQLGADDGSIRSGAAAERDAFKAFLLLPDALRIEFPPYQVGPWAIGAQTSTIPLAALAGFLRDDAFGTDASFDCGKAVTVVERAICADAALARLDRQMAQAYQLRLDGSADRIAERNAQRAWLKLRSSACADQAGPRLAACLTGIYRARLTELSGRP